MSKIDVKLGRSDAAVRRQIRILKALRRYYGLGPGTELYRAGALCAFEWLLGVSDSDPVSRLGEMRLAEEVDRKSQ